MSIELDYASKNFDEIKDIFNAHLSKQFVIKKYPISFLKIRSKLVDWIIKVCEKFYFKKETLFRTISLFDMYVSLASQKENETIYKSRLSIVSCLSLATKLNEINSNYTKFFTNTLLNQKGTTELYTNFDIAQKEMEILQTINYCLNSTNVYHFNNIFVILCLKYIRTEKIKEKFLLKNEHILKEYLQSEQCVLQSPINCAILVINATLKQFNKEEINIEEIIRTITSLNSQRI